MRLCHIFWGYPSSDRAEWASLEPLPADQEALMIAMQGNQKAINQFLGTYSGTFPVQEFSPENLNSIMNGSNMATLS